MTFTHDNADLGKIIKRYDVTNNVYTIDYLDGSTSSYYLSCDNTNKLNEIMLNQIIERDNSDLFDKLSKQIKDCLKSLIIFIPVTILCKITFFNIILILLIALILNKCISNKRKINELKKYKLFLEMINDLDKVNDSKFLKQFEFDNLYHQQITINSLDDLSYGYVKKVYKSLKKETNL